MKNSKEVFEQNISFLIKVKHTLNTRKQSVVGMKIICAYYFNEEKGLQG